MKAKIIIALVAVIGILGLVGCKPKPTTLTGQVFIVTQGGDSVKFGDVSILLIEKSQVTDFLEKKEPLIDAKIASRKQEIVVAKEEWKKSSSACEEEKGSGHVWEALDDARNAAYDRLTATMIKLGNSPAAEDYFVDFFPEATQRTLSDADGKFSFVYPRDKSFTIYASADRRILNGFEHYYWLIDAPTNAETLQVFLSNNNLVEVDPGGYFKLKPKQALPEKVAWSRVVRQIAAERLKQ
jgi:hypothetical protein